MMRSTPGQCDGSNFTDRDVLAQGEQRLRMYRQRRR